MSEEKGVLPFGIEFGGQVYRHFTLRPLKVKDTLGMHKAVGAQFFIGDEERTGLYLLGQRLSFDGMAAEGTPFLSMLEMYDEDLAEIVAADARLKTAISSFRGAFTAAPEVNAGPDEAGVFREPGAGDERAGG